MRKFTELNKEAWNRRAELIHELANLDCHGEEQFYCDMCDSEIDKDTAYNNTLAGLDLCNTCVHLIEATVRKQKANFMDWIRSNAQFEDYYE